MSDLQSAVALDRGGLQIMTILKTIRLDSWKLRTETSTCHASLHSTSCCMSMLCSNATCCLYLWRVTTLYLDVAKLLHWIHRVTEDLGLWVTGQCQTLWHARVCWSTVLHLYLCLPLLVDDNQGWWVTYHSGQCWQSCAQPQTGWARNWDLLPLEKKSLLWDHPARRPSWLLTC